MLVHRDIGVFLTKDLVQVLQFTNKEDIQRRALFDQVSTPLCVGGEGHLFAHGLL
jgi:hypothetical protein